MAEPGLIERLDRIEGWPAPEERGDWYGDSAAERTLLDAYRGGRMHHAWLFGGPRGIGKATLAYRFARFVLAHPLPAAPEVAAAADLSVAAGHPAFRQVASRSHPGLLVLERPLHRDRKHYLSALTVDEIRRTVSFFGSTSASENWRVSIVDPADDMNPSAANALLKVLEEPPRRSLFLIVSHAPGRLLPTIRSRCRRLALAPLAEDVVKAAVTENAPDRSSFDPAELALASALAEGSLRRAILLLEQNGVDTYRKFVRIAASLPELDLAAVHAFADGVTGRGADDAYRGFLDTVRAWLDRRVRGEDEPVPDAAPSPQVGAVSLARWAEVWEKTELSAARADELNLDRKQVVLSILMALARATRM